MKKFAKGIVALAICGVVNFGFSFDKVSAEEISDTDSVANIVESAEVESNNLDLTTELETGELARVVELRPGPPPPHRPGPPPPPDYRRRPGPPPPPPHYNQPPPRRPGGPPPPPPHHRPGPGGPRW